MAETITIPRKEYEKLKGKKDIDFALLSKIAKGLEDVKAGRIKEWK